jgi:hypothetical protein
MLPTDTRAAVPPLRRREQSMHALLTVLVTWLSVNYGLSGTLEHPQIELAPPAKMAAVRYSRLQGAMPDRVAAEAGKSAPPEFG